jgi:hypothetical protein
MRKITPWTLALVASVFAYSALAEVTGVEEGIGDPYGARDAVLCDSSAPADGPPSSEQAAEYVKCTIEGIGDGRLYLIDDATATVGEPREFNPQLDRYYEGIQTGTTMYPITGSLIRWECETILATNEGANCRSGHEMNARGVCYKTVNNDWRCTMSGGSQLNEGIPGPQE